MTTNDHNGARSGASGDDPRLRGRTGGPSGTMASLQRTDTLTRALLHELAGLLDGSTRYLRLAQRSLADGPDPAARTARALHHLAAAEGALLTMASLITPSRAVLEDDVDLGALGDRFARQPVEQAISAAVEHVRPIADALGIRIDLSIETDAAALPPAPLYPVAVNGLRNAIEAIGRAGVVLVRVGATDDGAATRIVIDISDSGPGIDDEQAARAFDLGFTTKPGGSGVGLALSRDIVQRLGGTIDLRPRGGGRGATLHVEVPLVLVDPGGEIVG